MGYYPGRPAPWRPAGHGAVAAEVAPASTPAGDVPARRGSARLLVRLRTGDHGIIGFIGLNGLVDKRQHITYFYVLGLSGDLTIIAHFGASASACSRPLSPPPAAG